MALLGTLALLSAVGLPALARSRQPAHRVACANNLRQLGQALLMFSSENDQSFPPRLLPGSWPERLRPYYHDLGILRCPSDGTNPRTAIHDPVRYPADSAPRSYIFNGWDDYFQSTIPNWTLGAMMGKSLPTSAIKLPNATIVFGDKPTDSVHFYFDLIQGSGNDFEESEQRRHFPSVNDRASGGSNHGFADGSVRFLKYGRSLYPTNLWAVQDEWRVYAILPGP